MFARLKSIVLDRRTPEVLFECRHCGETLDPGVERCPACASTRIARYEIR